MKEKVHKENIFLNEYTRNKMNEAKSNKNKRSHIGKSTLKIGGIRLLFQ